MKEKKKKIAVLPLTTVFSLISIGLFITKTLNSFYGKANAEGASPIIKYAVLPLLIVFALCFAAAVVCNIRDARALKKNAADTKYAMKTTKSVSAVIEAVMQLINVIIAIVIAYDTYAGGDIKWYNFKFYFTMIILIYTLMTTVYFIIKKTVKLIKKAEKRKAAAQKAEEKQVKAEERQKQIEAAKQLKAQKDAERREAEKALTPKKDQSKKPVKKVTKK